MNGLIDLAKSIPGVYPASVQTCEGAVFCLRRKNLSKKLLILGAGNISALFKGEIIQQGSVKIKEAPLEHTTAEILRRLFDWTAPRSLGKSGVSLGLGDRLGLATPGHLAALAGTSIRPVLAQQSKRELQLTGRDYSDVLDAASFAVFQTGYTAGFGADGDHLKTGRDIQHALDLGFSMITLDCSEQIAHQIGELSTDEVTAKYQRLCSERRERLEQKYLKTDHVLQSGREISFEGLALQRTILIYHQALDFAEQIYGKYVAPRTRPLDFEVSIDEVAIPTTPQDHYFVASELTARGVSVSGIAPRFCGAFEKGVDYQGDLEQFEQEYRVHAEIAEHFGYKVSVHSGSDKFRIFPIVGRYSKDRLHLKTAGTSWLEALRVIAGVNPDLFRRIYALGRLNLDAARKYYLVTLDPVQLPELADWEDESLLALLEQRDARQALHITYGFILADRQLRAELYHTLISREDLYDSALTTHIQKHIRTLGLI